MELRARKALRRCDRIGGHRRFHLPSSPRDGPRTLTALNILRFRDQTKFGQRPKSSSSRSNLLQRIKLLFAATITHVRVLFSSDF